MKNKGNKWLSISVFVAKCNWHILLKDVIHPYINMLFDEDKIISFKLQFDYLCGENIRLALLVPNHLAYKVAKKTDIYFKAFFKKEQLLPISNEGPFNSVFMPYPQNTVQYGLYSTSILSESDDLLIFQQAISEAMIEVFADDNIIDDEIILTFGLYILFGCYKIIRSSNLLFEESCLALYKAQTESVKTLNIDHDLIQVKYDELSSNIDEIYADVMNPLTYDNLIWLGKLEVALIKMIEVIRDKKHEMVFFNQINFLLNQQLGLNDFSGMLLNIFIYRTISKQDYELEKFQYAG